jgi:hypothetical protein
MLCRLIAAAVPRMTRIRGFATLSGRSVGPITGHSGSLEAGSSRKMPWLCSRGRVIQTLEDPQRPIDCGPRSLGALALVRPPGMPCTLAAERRDPCATGFAEEV